MSLVLKRIRGYLTIPMWRRFCDGSDTYLFAKTRVDIFYNTYVLNNKMRPWRFVVKIKFVFCVLYYTIYHVYYILSDISTIAPVTTVRRRWLSHILWATCGQTRNWMFLRHIISYKNEKDVKWYSYNLF